MAAKMILMVDDDRDFVEAVSSYLESNGYRVVRAHDAAEGLKLAKMERPDLIIMDIMMKERTEGFFAVQELRRAPELEKIPVFVVTSLYTALGDFKIQPDGNWLAHDEFFTKPVRLPLFLEKIKMHIGDGLASQSANAGTRPL